MTTSPPDRLDRIERILEELAASQQQTDQRIAAVSEQQQLTQRQLELTRSIVESNAKAITALGQTVTDDREETAETASQNRVQGRDNERMIEVLISESQENIRQHQAFTERFEENMRQHRAFTERFEENTLQHQTFTERFDRMLLEIQRIWQRIAG